MKLTKRLLSMLLVLCMAFSMLPAMGLTASAATAEAPTGTYVKQSGTSITKNGSYILVFTGGHILANTNSSSSNYVSVVSGYSALPDSITVDSSNTNLVWNVQDYTDSGTFKLVGPNGEAKGAKSSMTVTTSGSTWMMDGNYIKTSDGYYIKYVSTSGFRCYNTSGNRTTLSAVYMLDTGSSATYTATAESNNTAYGTVALNGSTITATPTSDAYYVTGTYTVSPANAAQVLYNGDNTFTVSNVTADCTIAIDFAQKQAATLTYSENGATHNASGTYYVGDSVTLADPVNAAPATYTFMGWLPSTYATNDTAPANLLKVGDRYTLSAADNTLYAVYAIAGEGGSNSSITSLTSGTYYMVDTYNGSYYAMSGTGTTSVTSVDISAAVTENTDGTISIDGTNSVITEAMQYNVTVGASTTTVQNVSNSSYVGGNTSTSFTTSSANAWTVTERNDRFTFVYSTRCILYRSNYDYRCYAYSNRGASGYGTGYLYLVPTTGGAAYTGYTTTVNTAATYYTLNYSASPADGGSITCASASGASIAENDVVELTAVAAEHYSFSGWTVTGIGADDYTATGNSLLVTMSNDVTVVANFTAESTYTVTVNQATGGTMAASKVSGIYAGETITLTATPDAHYSFGGWQVVSGGASITGNSFTMPASNVVITGSFVENAQYTVTYYDKDGHVCATKTYYDGETILASDVPSVEAPDGFAFKDWYSTTYNGTDAPAYTAPAGTTVNGNMEFHAVYAELGEGGSGGTIKLKLNDTTYVGARSGSNAYMSVATTEADAAEFRLESTGTDGEYYIYDVTDGQYIGWDSGTSMAFSSSTSASYIWVYDQAAGTFLNKSSGTRYLGYNSNRFSTYVSSYPHAFTVLGGTSYSGYTTNPVSTKISVTWMNGTDIFKTEKVAYGVAIVAPATNPEKTEEEQQYFTFAGWSEDGSTVITSFPTASEALGDKTYYAVYTTVSKLTVTWKNYDGTTLLTEYYKAGETPTYKGSEPTKPADSSFYYTFSGWDPTVSPVTAAITYTATFTQNDRFELTASLSKDTVKVSKSAQVNYTLTDMGTETTAFTPTFSVGNSTVASVDANGKITAKAVGSTTVTITFAGALDASANPISKTMNLVVIENTSSGGYTLITQNNVPTDWSGDYIIMGKLGGDTTYMNTWMILTPDYDTGTAKIADDNKDAATITLTDDGSGIGTGTINDEGNASSSVDKKIVMEDTGLVTDTNNDNSILVYDTITEIDDAYAFTIECIDDVNQIYTIRVKDTDLYIACAKVGATKNSLNFSSSATEYAQWKFSVESVTKGGYNNDIITAQNVGNTDRRLYFNSNQYGAIDGQFRDYRTVAYGSMIGGNASGLGQAYNLYLFGNPNPFKAQIYYHGDQITLVDTGKINANATTAQLVGALTPDIEGYPNWTQVGDPEWVIVENSTGNNMTVDSATGLIKTNASTVGSYALVKITYTIHDEINNVNQRVSTTAKVEVIAADTTYSTVIYETYSGTDTEVQYTVPNSMTTLPLAAYVVNDNTDDNSKTGSVVMGGTLAWSAVKSSGGGTNATVSIDSDGTLHMANFASDAIITVTVSGATGDSIAASSATYKVYVKTAEYTLTVVPTIDSQGTYDSASDILTVASGESSAHLTYTVVDGDNNGPGSDTFTLAGYAWTLSGDTYGAMINSSGLLDFTGMDRSEDRTITAVVSRVAATDVASGVTKSNLTDTITIVVKAQTVVEVLEAVNDTVIIDWALPVTFNVLKNDNYNVAVSVTADTLPTGVSANGDGTFTYTPSGWQTTDQTFTYMLSGTVDGVETSSEATVTLKTADSIYYEDTYSGIFTFDGNWVDVANGTKVAEQTSSLDTADVFEYDANHTEYAMYSGGTAKMTTLVKGSNASVTFSFAGTGFDIISATTNNTGAIMLTVKDAGGAVVTDPNTGRKLAQIIDIFRGYTYVEDGYTRYGLEEVTRYKLEGGFYIPDAAGNYYYDAETAAFVENTVWYTPAENMTDKYYDSANQFESMQDENGTYVLKEYTSNWLPSTEENSDSSYYQIPILKVTGLSYGTYTVTVKPVYSTAYDRQGDGSYDFIFDGVRIHNPVAGREAEYKYISLRDAVKESGFGSGTVVACDHVGHEWSDWTFYSRARNTTSATTCNRGSFVQYCNYCGGVANTAYFHVNITADATELGVGGYNGLPSTTMLHYTLTADECGDAAVQASIQAKLDAISGTLTEYWSSNTRDIMTCMNNSNVVIANGIGTTYATLQLKDPATQTIYASAIHSPMITVSADETHTHTFGAWVHDADSDPSTHTHTCTADTCSYYETEACVFTSEVTTQPTQTTEGVRTYTCTGCGYSYTESIPALGGYTATFHVPEGATAPAAQTGDSATMPAAVAAPADYDAHSYTFVGWIADAGLSDTESRPTMVYAPDETFTLTKDTSFYALYTYDVTTTGSTESGYYLSTEAPQAGDNIILAGSTDGTSYTAMKHGTATKSTDVSTIELPVVGGKVTTVPDYTTWTVQSDKTLENGNSRYLHINGSTVKYATGTTNGIIEYTTNGNGFKVHASDSTQANKYLTFASSKFSSTTEADASTIYIFKLTEGSGTTTTPYYTTDLKVATGYNASIYSDKTTLTVGETLEMASWLNNGTETVPSTEYDGCAWSTSNASVVSITSSSDGYCNVTAESAGTATISVTYTIGSETAARSITLTVNAAGSSTGADEVVYVTDSSTGYIYNWGTRGTTATFLTTYATDYYTGSYSYNTLSALSGTTSTSAIDIYSSALGQAIHSMLANKQSKTPTYDDTRDLFCYTDCEESNTSTISSYYSGTALNSKWDGGSTWNREHTWPKSKGLKGNDENDIMMLRPTSVTENSSRENTAYGESSGFYDPNSESSTLNLHGDVARLMLQHMMRWGNVDNMFGSSGVMESRAVLLKWMEEDPVDTWEMGRNDAVQSITGVRNVFVDYPELGFKLLGAEVPSGYSTPSTSGVKAATYSSATDIGDEPAVRSIPTGNFTGAAIIDGMGKSNVADSFGAYGPDYGVYLAPGQGIVFSLASDVTNITTQDLQIGAKAVNGTATQMDVASISNGVKYLLQDQAIASATEMYYELDGSQVGWSNGNSSIIVIYNSGSGVLDVTNIRYSTANGNTLTLTINDTQTKNAARMLSVVYGTAATVSDPNNVEPTTEPVTPSDVPTESTEPETPVVTEEPAETEDPAESKDPTEPTEPTEPAEPEYKVEQFKDVSEKDWFYDGVKYAVDSGLMNGVASDEFAPDDMLTRAMLVTILYRLAGEPTVDGKAEMTFTDIDADSWYYDAVVWAISNDITKGVSAKFFAPDDAVTREQLVTFLWRYADEPESKQSLDSFPDADKVSSFAEVAMSWAVENELIAGNAIGGKDYLDPQGNATRAQIAIIFMRSEKTLALSD